MRRPKLLPALLLSIPALALGAGEGHAQTGADRFERLVRIGAVDGPPEYTFGLVSDVAFGPGESIHVLDAMNGVVSVYDFSGRFVRKFGRSGEGPGEFRFPTRLLITDSVVSVVDGTQRRVSEFTVTGQHIRTVPLGSARADHDVIYPLRHGYWIAGRSSSFLIGRPLMELRGQTRAMIRRNGPSARAHNAPAVVLVHPAGAPVDTIFQYDHGRILVINDRTVHGVNRFWGEGGAWAVSGDSLVAVLDAFQGHLRILRAEPHGLAPVRSGRVPITPRPLDHSDWQRVVDSDSTERRRAANGHLLGPSFQALLGEIFFASDGTLWIARIDYDPTGSRPPESQSYLLIPPDGRAQTTQTLPDGFRLRAVRGDHLLGHRRDELGVQYVEVWRRAREP